ncbi:hypothetical protein BT67DRAFT_161575 [Trichocladium antarcticum]|uniref:Uncharacterized protein n=1 Tax=Trichocladium antarcticum TaxID=1450529 RepID=A0AAN6Z9T2_9PEZI|nr:hypothetical protein BT67DRAFT_161575 [Trichocladium antarcticum]
MQSASVIHLRLPDCTIQFWHVGKRERERERARAGGIRLVSTCDSRIHLRSLTPCRHIRLGTLTNRLTAVPAILDSSFFPSLSKPRPAARSTRSRVSTLFRSEWDHFRCHDILRLASWLAMRPHKQAGTSIRMEARPLRTRFPPRTLRDQSSPKMLPPGAKCAQEQKKPMSGHTPAS